MNHNILQIHNNVMWDSQYYVEYSIVHIEYGEYVNPIEHCYGYE